jgi:hypothetical protein
MRPARMGLTAMAVGGPCLVAGGRYQLPGSITRDGRPIIGGTDINRTDAAFAARIYPKPGRQGAVAGAATAANAEHIEADDWDESEDVQASDPRIHPNPGHQGAAAGAAAAANADHIETDDWNESEDVSASDLVDVLRLTKRSTAKKPAWSGLHGHGSARAGGGPVSGGGEVAGHDKFIAIEGALLSIEANWTTHTTQWDRPARSARMVRKSIAE